jgi:hypothetical protein
MFQGDFMSDSIVKRPYGEPQIDEKGAGFFPESKRDDIFNYLFMRALQLNSFQDNKAANKHYELGFHLSECKVTAVPGKESFYVFGCETMAPHTRESLDLTWPEGIELINKKVDEAFGFIKELDLTPKNTAKVPI